MIGSDSQVTAAFAVGRTSAAGFATASALQHQAAGGVPESVEKALRVLAHLARQRIWLTATAVSFSAMLLHALALRLGSLALVQPLMLVGVVLAVPLRAALGEEDSDAVRNEGRVHDGRRSRPLRCLHEPHAVPARIRS
jgi:hypothetical protein